MTYLVIKDFTDLQDNNHKYRVGDVFPHSDLKISQNRLKELSTNENRRGIPVIKAVEEPKPDDAPVDDAPMVNVIAEKPKRGRKKKNAD